ncbi:MAG: AI-2E family transporter [Candidatus Eremiobacteraeota bacterium]|nr:AI-2E family transporter [Candidatus Eremiobacteraeota bacterium]
MEPIKKKFYYAGYIIFLLILISVVLWLLSHIIHVVITLVGSIFLAYFLHPMVKFFENPINLIIPEDILIFRKKIRLGNNERRFNLHKKGYSKIVSIIIVYLIMAFLAIMLISFIIPRVNSEFNTFTTKLPQFTEEAQKKIDDFNKSLEPKLPSFARNIIPNMIEKISTELENFTVRVLSHSFSMAGKVFSTAVTIIIIPLFTFYILMDAKVFKRGIRILIPESRKEEILGLLKEIDMMIGRYIRGQVLICIIIGTSISIVLTILGIEYAFLIGIFAGLVEVIPYLGVVIGLIPAFGIALFSKGFGFAILVLIVLESVHWFEGHIIVPAVMGKTVGLPPLIVIVALFVGGELMGLLGMFIAIPIAAIIRVVFNYYLRLHEKRRKIEEEEVREIESGEK